MGAKARQQSTGIKISATPEEKFRRGLRSIWAMTYVCGQSMLKMSLEAKDPQIQDFLRAGGCAGLLAALTTSHIEGVEEIDWGPGGKEEIIKQITNAEGSLHEIFAKMLAV